MSGNLHIERVMERVFRELLHQQIVNRLQLLVEEKED